MANERGKTIDNTHLSIDQAEARGFIHRDYLAHCLRWSHVVRELGRQPGQWRVLDVGCGREVPLARTLYTSRLIVQDYVGIDYNQLTKPEMFHTGTFPIRLFGGVDFATLKHESQAPGMLALVLPDGRFYEPNIIVSFEMIEHVEPAHCRRVLQSFHGLMNANSRAFISTPCYDAQVGAAANHVNEMTYQALGALLEDLGFQISAVYGTFASLADYERPFKLKYGSSGAKVFDALKAYYDVNYLSTIFAPLMPQASRNCLWELQIPNVDYVRRFKRLAEVSGRWSSSEKWGELNG